MDCIWNLDSISESDLKHVGAKALSLARLHRHGLPVPPAIVLPVEAMEVYLLHNDLQDELQKTASLGEKDLSGIRERIRGGSWPVGMKESVLAAAHTLGPVGTGVAVRSSAVDEDGESHSFAGQYATFLNAIAPTEILEAIQACWASWFSFEAMAYRQKKGLFSLSGMAVLLQKQVHARASGVLFTINPHSGSWKEMVLESCWGQGTALVSGKVRPDRTILSRPRKRIKSVQRVLARLRVESIDQELGGQREGLYPSDAGGLSWCRVDRIGDRVLSEEDSRRVGRLGLRSEALLGLPQDLEWSIDTHGVLFLLQSRPITALPVQRGDETLWTRRFFGERWTEMATPMGWSVVQDSLHHFVAYEKTAGAHWGGEAPTRLYRGRPYFNVTVFRHLLFKFPGAPPPRFLLEFLPPEEERRWLRRHAVSPGVPVYLSILRETFLEKRWQRFRWNPLSNPRAWDVYQSRLEKELPGLCDPNGDGFNQLQRAEELLREYIKIHICSLLFANLLYQICEGFLEPELRQDALRCPRENRTQEVNRALFELSRGGSIESFLDQHGHRASSSSWEIFSPRWSDDPGAVERLIRPYREGSLSDPLDLAAKQEKASRDALEKIRKGSGRGVFRGRVLEKLVRLTRRYLQLREDQRYEFDRLLFSMKGVFLRIGQDVLGEEYAEDVAYLTLEELKSGQPAKELLRMAKKRQKQWSEWSSAPLPPVFLRHEDEEELYAEDKFLRGLGISAGVCSGRVRFLDSPERAGDFKPGDILVTRATDPGWTPLFLVAGAVLLELGSMLSHGAVLAREYGLPAVVNIPDLFERLQEGQKITVDGTRGVVWLDPRE